MSCEQWLHLSQLGMVLLNMGPELNELCLRTTAWTKFAMQFKLAKSACTAYLVSGTHNGQWLDERGLLYVQSGSGVLAIVQLAR
jgi:hypothetical protein